MGMREIILGAVLVLAAYLAYLLIQLVRPARAKAPLDPLRSAAPDATPRARPEPGGGSEEFFRMQFELQQLRAEQSAYQESLRTLGAEVEALRGLVDGLQQRVEATPAATAVSPQYGEAMLLARRGLDAHTIAERCGISVGEAELVQSLARRGEGA